MVPRVLLFSSSRGLRNCLYKGVGLTVCPAVAVREELSLGLLERLDWVGEVQETSVIMIWHRDKWCSPLLSRFMELAEELMGADTAERDEG